MSPFLVPDPSSNVHSYNSCASNPIFISNCLHMWGTGLVFWVTTSGSQASLELPEGNVKGSRKSVIHGVFFRSWPLECRFTATFKEAEASGPVSYVLPEILLSFLNANKYNRIWVIAIKLINYKFNNFKLQVQNKYPTVLYFPNPSRNMTSAGEVSKLSNSQIVSTHATLL